MATHGERVATRQAIREFMLSQERYWTSGNDVGRYNAVYPNGDGKRDIPDFTEVVPDWIWRYYLETGDVAALEDVYGNLTATADYVRRHIPADRANGRSGHQPQRRHRPVPLRHRRLADARAGSTTT